MQWIENNGVHSTRIGGNFFEVYREDDVEVHPFRIDWAKIIQETPTALNLRWFHEPDFYTDFGAGNADSAQEAMKIVEEFVEFNERLIEMNYDQVQRHYRH